jgi:tetratricopeptide (TPR) repeat protein
MRCPLLTALLIASLCAVGPAARAAAPRSYPDLERSIEAAAQSGKLESSVIVVVQDLPAKERSRLALKLVESAHVDMRERACMWLWDARPEVAAATMCKLLKDVSPHVRKSAVEYLAVRADDPDAQGFLAKEAASADPKIAAHAVQILSRCETKNPAVPQVLRKLIDDKATPPEARMDAINGAGRLRAFECTPALVATLVEKEEPPRRWSGRRICDIAAGALEDIYRINLTEPIRHGEPVETRDERIALWKKWYAAEGKLPPEVARANYALRLIDETLETLKAQPDEKTRANLKWRLVEALGTGFCLGELPGVDAIVAPNVRDLWRLLRVSKPEEWHRFRNSWESHHYLFQRTFLKAKGIRAAAPDRQAFEFIRFANGTPNFPRVRVWGFCRDFAEAFPKSEHRAAVTGIQEQLGAELQAGKNQVVLHGHAAVLEPLPTPVPEGGNMVPVYRQYLASRARQEPSNWAFLRVVVDAAASARKQGEVAGEDSELFRELAQLYPGNEWPFLASAAYLLRVRNEPDSAIEFADRALILNPGNAKAYALRGIARMATGKADQAAAKDLALAARLDPESLGDEPETEQAVAFLIRQTREAGKKAQAQVYSDGLAGLKALRLDHPIPEYRALLQGPKQR